jgi:hypothetical protein
MVRAVFLFEGDSLQDVFPTVTAAEEGTEIYDIDVHTYLGEDGTVLAASAEGYEVRLPQTGERSLNELRRLLRLHFESDLSGFEPALAEDPLAAAQALLDMEWESRAFRWFPWLDRRLNGADRPRVL